MFKYLITMMLAMVMSVAFAEVLTSSNSPPGVEISYDQTDVFTSVTVGVVTLTPVMYDIYRKGEVPYIRAGELELFVNTMDYGTMQLSRFMICQITGNPLRVMETHNEQSRHYTLIGYSIWN